MKAGTLILTVVLLVAVAATFTETGSGSGMESAGSKALVGSWKVTVASQVAPPFQEMMTFTEGGGVIESNTFPFFAQNLTAGPGHGTWRYLGGQQFPFTFVKFLYAPNGPAIGTLKVVGTITYTPATDTWSGPADVWICDVNAENCNTPLGPTNGEATRISAGQ